MRGLTAVFAHPDDETFAIGGSLARYSGDGVRCSLYCATDGDAGRSSGVPVCRTIERAAYPVTRVAGQRPADREGLVVGMGEDGGEAPHRDYVSGDRRAVW